MPPPSMLRAGSQPPGARSGSAAPQEHRVISAPSHHTTISGSPKHRTITTTSVVRGVRGDGTSGVVNVGPARRRASISVMPSSVSAATGSQQQPIVRSCLQRRTLSQYDVIIWCMICARKMAGKRLVFFQHVN